MRNLLLVALGLAVGAVASTGSYFAGLNDIVQPQPSLKIVQGPMDTVACIKAIGDAATQLSPAYRAEYVLTYTGSCFSPDYAPVDLPSCINALTVAGQVVSGPSRSDYLVKFTPRCMEQAKNQPGVQTQTTAGGLNGKEENGS